MHPERDDRHDIPASQCALPLFLPFLPCLWPPSVSSWVVFELVGRNISDSPCVCVFAWQSQCVVLGAGAEILGSEHVLMSTAEPECSGSGPFCFTGTVVSNKGNEEP